MAARTVRPEPDEGTFQLPAAYWQSFYLFALFVGEAFMPDALVAACRKASRLKPAPTKIQ